MWARGPSHSTCVCVGRMPTTWESGCMDRESITQARRCAKAQAVWVSQGGPITQPSVGGAN